MVFLKRWGGRVPFLFPCVPDDHVFTSLHYGAQTARHMIEELSWNNGKIILYLFYFLTHTKIFIENILCMVQALGHDSPVLSGAYSLVREGIH